MTYSPTPKSYAYEFKNSMDDNSGVTFKQVRMKENSNIDIKMESITDTTSLKSIRCKNIEYCKNELESSSNSIEKKTLREDQSVLNCSGIDKLFGKEDTVNKMKLRNKNKYISPKSGKDLEINYIPTPKSLLNANKINAKRFDNVSDVITKQDRIKEIENINNRIVSVTDSLSSSLKRCKQIEYYKANIRNKSNANQNRTLIEQDCVMNCSRIQEIFGKEDINDKITLQKDIEYIPQKCGKVSNKAYIPTPKVLLYTNELNSKRLDDMSDVSSKHVQIEENKINEYESSNSIENSTLGENKGVMNRGGTGNDDNFEKEDIVNKVRFRKDNKYIPPKSGKVPDIIYIPTPKSLLSGNESNSNTFPDITYIPTPKSLLSGNESNSKRMKDVSCVTTKCVQIKENKIINIKTQSVTDTLNSASQRGKRNEYYNDELVTFSNITIQNPTLKEKEIVTNVSRIKNIFGMNGNVNETKFEKASLEYILKENSITCYRIESVESPDTQNKQQNEAILDHRKINSNSNIIEIMDQNSPCKDEKSGKGNTKSNDQNIENMFLSSYIDKYSTNKDNYLTNDEITQSMTKSCSNVGDKVKNKNNIKINDKNLQRKELSLHPSSTTISEENLKEYNNESNNVSSISADEIFKISSEPKNISLKLGGSVTENNVLEDFSNMHDVFDLDIDGWESNISKAQPMAKTKEAMAEFEMMYKDFKSGRKRQNQNITDMPKLNSWLTKNNKKSNPPLHVKEPMVSVSKDFEILICENNLICENSISKEEKLDKKMKITNDSRFILENSSSELSSEQTFEFHDPGVGIDVNENKKGDQVVLKKNAPKQIKRKNDLMKPKDVYLAKNQITNTGKNTHQCNLCDKVFSQNQFLVLHMRTHTGERPYQCSRCEKAFSLKGNLNKHLKIHTREKPYQCSDCVEAFSHNKYLKEHLKIHCMEKLYHCSLCDKAFFTNSNLSRHKRTHSEEQPYQYSQYDKDESKMIKSSIGETEEEIGLKKFNICIKRAYKFEKSRIESSDESDTEVLRANDTRNNDSISNQKSKEKKHPKKYIKSNIKVDELKKIRIKSDEENEKKDPQSVVTINVKSKSGFETKEDIHVINYRNHKKYIDKLRISRKKCEDKVAQTTATRNKHAKSIIKDDKKFPEKNKVDPKKKRKVEKSQEEYNEKQVEVEEFFLSDSDEGGDSFNNDTVIKSNSKAMEDLVGAIGKVFDLIENSTKGVWTKTPNQIEQDLQDVFQSLKLEKFEDRYYPKMYNLDINYRQLYIHFSGVDSMLLQHAFMSKLRYPNCKNIPHEHQEDMQCCI